MASHYNPLAPLTPKQLSRVARRYVQSQFGPVLSQINNEYATRSRAGAAAIQSSTAQLANALGSAAPQTHAIYGQAQSAQKAIDDAIAAKLTAAGQGVQNDVGGQLAQAGITPTQNLAQTGAGAAAASFGMGSAALSRLVAEGAARENYSAALPNIARLGGAQHGQDLALQLESGRQKDVGALRAKIPGATAQIEQDLANREFQKAAANLTFGTNQQKLAIDSAYKGAKIKQGQQRLSQQDRALNIKAQQNSVANLFKQAGLNISAERLKIAQHHETAYEKGRSGKRGGFTPTQIQKMGSNALEAAKALKKGQPNPNYDPSSSNYHNGIPDKQPKTYPTGKAVGARGAFLYLTNHQIPPSLAADIVGRVYGPWLKKGDKKRLGL